MFPALKAASTSCGYAASAAAISGDLTVGQNAAYIRATAAIAPVQPGSDRRASQSALPYGSRSNMVGLRPRVVVEEDLLQVRLLAEQVPHRVPGSGLDQLVGVPGQPPAQGRAGHGQVGEARHPG